MCLFYLLQLLEENVASKTTRMWNFFPKALFVGKQMCVSVSVKFLNERVSFHLVIHLKIPAAVQPIVTRLLC